jgi:type II secretion system protein H
LSSSIGTFCRDRGGFSLVELTAVLVILAIASGAAVLRYQSSLESARIDSAAERIEQLDRRSRAYARGQGQGVLVGLDLSAGRIWCQDRDGRRLPWSLELGEDLRLAEAAVAGESSSIGSISLLISRQGLSPTYAVCLEDSQGRRRWIAFAGLTGQIWHPQGRPELSRLLESEDRP